MQFLVVDQEKIVKQLFAQQEAFLTLLMNFYSQEFLKVMFSKIWTMVGIMTTEMMMVIMVTKVAILIQLKLLQLLLKIQTLNKFDRELFLTQHFTISLCRNYKINNQHCMS